MNSEPIVVKEKLDAPVTKVWNAITDKKIMKHWYFDIADFKPEPGFEFQFTGGEEVKYLHLCKIREVILLKKLSYTWVYEGQDAETLVTFNLEEDGNKTWVELVHEGVEKLAPYGADFAKENFIKGWSHIIGTSLKEAVETMKITSSIEINSQPETVWNLLVDHEKIKQWAAAFSEGTTIETNWSIGSEVIWKDGEGNIGAKGIVKIFQPHKKLHVRYYDDANAEPGSPLGDYSEIFNIDGSTLLKIESGPVMKKHGLMQQPMWEDALIRIKTMAEK
ncbi:MAG: SRPBCC domain-containing protein [Flavisolibacter sp.]|nr:SRPBCC domain-containing protein [Flavisolibacter sp.]